MNPAAKSLVVFPDVSLDLSPVLHMFTLILNPSAARSYNIQFVLLFCS